MRFPQPRSMEALLIIALAVTVIVTMFAIKEPPADETRFTLERNDAPQLISERRTPLIAEEAAPGR